MMASAAILQGKKGQNIRHLDYTELENFLLSIGEKKFRAKQVWEWLWQKHAKSFADMTNLSKELSGLGVFGLLVVIMALMLFSFYLQLVIARSKENLQLLLLIGYSPLWLSKNVSKRFIPIYVLIVLAALALTQGMQWAFHHLVMYDREELSTPVHWSVIGLAITLIALSAVTNYRLVKKLLYKLF